MRYHSIKSHLRPYSIRGRRTTTISHAFAAAIAPNDTFDDARVRDAMTVLGQDPDADLACVYCDAPAETWDHIFSTVVQSRFSGHGHRLGNLVPCCKPCNSKKGNKKWNDYLAKIQSGAHDDAKREVRIANYIARFSVLDAAPSSDLHDRLEKIRQSVLSLLSEADELAAEIRATELAAASGVKRQVD